MPTTHRPRGSLSPSSGGAGRPASSKTENSGADAIRELVGDVRVLLRDELRTAQDELAGKARVASDGVLLLGVAAVLGAVAAGTSTVMIMRTLEKVLPPIMAAAVATIIFTVAAAVLARVGLAEVRRALPLFPEQALDELREEIREMLPG
jgi:hypothetical protein